jgi:FkbM family methyltransferase
VGLIGTSPRLRGLALRALLDRQLAPGVLCRVPFDDHTLYVDPRDDKIALKLLTGRPWQRRELAMAIATLREAGAHRPNGIFVDVGANIGAQSVYAMRSGAFARAIAIEPDPHNFDILKRNLTVNGLEDCVKPIAAAASDASGRLQLARHRKNYGAHSVEVAYVPRPAGSLDVAAVALDDLMQRQCIAADDVALVKIDVEGHELAVLEGMTGLRRAGVPVLIEFTADRGDTERLDKLKGQLVPYYSRVQDLSEGGASGPRPLAEITWRAPQVDLLVF